MLSCFETWIICKLVAVIAYVIFGWQAVYIEAANTDDSWVFTKSEQLLLDNQKIKPMTAANLNDLFQQLLKNLEFNIDEVNHNMH